MGKLATWSGGGAIMGTPYATNDRSEQGEGPETGVTGSVGTSSRLTFANADLVANS